VQLAEFGGRRAHGPQAATWVARAAYLAGFDATSNVLAGQRLAVPVVGTMAHSFIMSFPSEEEAFKRYLKLFPDQSILLVDTYDTIEGVKRATRMGRPIGGIRLDSGNLAELAREARQILDREGFSATRIFASGDLNEYKIARLLAGGVPIDAFGVGTQLSACADAPYVGGIYKLVELESEGRVTGKFKESTGKATHPGKKQVIREVDDGAMQGDRIVTLAGSLRSPEESRLLVPVMDGGAVLEKRPLERAREHCRRQLEALPARLRELDTDVVPYRVTVDPALEELLRMEKRRLQEREEQGRAD
jgi:nicotinate phosphoribosyltransferase